MTAFVAVMDSPATASMEIGQSLSGIFGCISVVAWICLLVMSTRPTPILYSSSDNLRQLPQLIANYKAQSADALSMGFLVIWLLGDITNLAGV